MLTENELKILYEILRKLKNKKAKSVLQKAILIIEKLIEDKKNLTSKRGNNGGIEKEFKQLTVDELKLLNKFIENKLSDEDEDYNELVELQAKIQQIYQRISMREFQKNKEEKLENSNQKLKEELCNSSGIGKKGFEKGL